MTNVSKCITWMYIQWSRNNKRSRYHKTVHISWEILYTLSYVLCYILSNMFITMSEYNFAGACLLFAINTLRPRQNGRHFAEDIFKFIFLNENLWISLRVSLEFVPKVPINNIPVLVQIMAWRRIGDKPLSEPMLIQFIDAYMRH